MDDRITLTFPVGIPGFPDAREFALEPWGDGDTPFAVLSCQEQRLEFLVVDPEVFFPDYDAEIDDETAAMIGLTDAVDGRVLVIVTVPERAADATANLLGPIVWNPGAGRAVQAVMSERWSTQHRLVA
jgi:flagellar assembly factor FliW